MGSPGPRLAAVASQPPDRPKADPSPAARPGEGRPRRGLWLLLVLAALAAVGLAIQTWRVGELSGQVHGLTAELQAAQTALDAYRGQLGEVRSSVADLQGRMDALDELVNRDPLAPPAPETP